MIGKPSGAQDTHKTSQRGQGVGAVVPGIGHEGRGADFLGVDSGVPEHAFFGDDGDDGRSQGQFAGNGEVQVAAAHDVPKTLNANRGAGESQHDGQHDGGHAFEAVMPVWMIPVRGFARHLDANHDDDGADDVRRGMDGIGNHGAGVGDDSRNQFECGQNDIQCHAAGGHPHGDGFVFFQLSLISAFFFHLKHFLFRAYI